MLLLNVSKAFDKFINFANIQRVLPHFKHRHQAILGAIMTLSKTVFHESINSFLLDPFKELGRPIVFFIKVIILFEV